ncbi:DUF5610 domain-containing protein [Pseudothauera lacus]|uniref:DUF5610 domain-containing protein n=1 Tax=Pseudothauera lacus TaxID=2136175 RepID=A0A2T4IIF3_9RHOO|nr:DUF5610 domain-containing protein [Pseudothauera lacus]PTD97547.1 hypothetical protein C8261_02370 [Pseudothauera lacus]
MPALPISPAGEARPASADKSAAPAAARPADTRAAAQQTLNTQILQSSLEVSIKAGDDALALLYRSAIDSLNETLEAELGPNAIENAAANQDNSPEATAERILSFATGFFEAFAAQRPDGDAEQVARDFVDLIRGGFEKGFNEARDILDGLGVLGGEVESAIMKTFELVHKGLDDFLASKLPPKPEAAGNEVV